MYLLNAQNVMSDSCCSLLMAILIEPGFVLRFVLMAPFLPCAHTTCPHCILIIYSIIYCFCMLPSYRITPLLRLLCISD